ncbi:uncharacterized protein DNG_06423 [Cephalotrichum gorgonifer]|uniref:Uncharacterized protein n=1 Tax=Cephalotrichum gorgonifer TaxID=2041049 RepID=A0AAE8MZX2_9PEZI|nr:uncharacterized protein DNG_06423 [Cephalotrichum gorgonifer]
MVFNSLGTGYVLFSTLHVILIILAAVVAGLYGTDVGRGKRPDGFGDGRWVYAIVVACLSALTAALHLIPMVLRFMLVWVWDFVLFILWIALFGIFGKLYIHEPANGNGETKRMKAAVWIVLVNALLWLLAALASLGYWWRHRERRSRFTGRAKVY